ncbi:hypothetical protein PQR57_47440 [Paraburkholderia dipogonis]|uniref:Uncharacterized protein n=1 Tax=Paraburkholderia dipogonis TaxID=1211383 RepID=A0ABW9B6F5_9BURK
MASRMTRQVTTTHKIKLASKSIVVLMPAIVNVEIVHSSIDAIEAATLTLNITLIEPKGKCSRAASHVV